LMSVDEWSSLMRSLSGWHIERLESFHVLPPVVGERLHLPRLLARLVDRIEFIATRRARRSGNCLLFVLERRDIQDGPGE
jgi:hypothetical protein